MTEAAMRMLRDLEKGHGQIQPELCTTHSKNADLLPRRLPRTRSLTAQKRVHRGRIDDFRSAAAQPDGSDKMPLFARKLKTQVSALMTL